MDNFAIDVTSAGRIQFVEVLSLAFAGAGYAKATHYVVEERCLTLLWADPPTSTTPTTPLLFPMDYGQAADFVWGWVCSHEDEVTRGGSDHVRLSLGWRIHSTPEGAGGYRQYAIATVQPIAALSGK